MGKRGPQLTQIDWEEFDKLAKYQCTQGDIADWFGVSVDTLENACLRDHGMKLSELFGQKKNNGKTRLRKLQWDIAEKGNPAMAIWLGKQNLGQSDKAMDEEIIEAIQESGLTRHAAIEILRNVAKVKELDSQKVSFEEFCKKAGYPAPYPKQIEMRDFILGESVARLLLGARGYGKTDYTIIMGLAYELYCDPTIMTLIMTKSAERNSAMLNEIKMACEKNGVIFEKANASCLRVRGHIGKDHNISTVTVRTTTLRGRHPNRVIMDDPVTEDDTSEATRKVVEKKWNELLKLTKNAAIIGQPAHKHDLYAKLRGLIKTIEFPHGCIPELDHDIEAQRAAGVSEASIQASYFLKILDEGQIAFGNIRYVDKFPTGSSAVAFLDPSNKGNDFTGLSIVKAYMEGVAVVGFAWQKAWNHCLDDALPLLKRFGVTQLAFETNNAGEQPIEMLRPLMAPLGIGVVGRFSTTEKHSTIMAAGAFSHLIHLSRESSPVYAKQTVEYEYGSKHDDAPDSLARCLEWIGLIRGKGRS